jgi:CheY-like chemotaxis protein
MSEHSPADAVTVLAVEDDLTTVRLLQKHITAAGHRFLSIDFSLILGDLADHVVSVVKDAGARVVICDLNLPGAGNISSVTNGLAVLRKLGAVTNTHVIAISGAIDEGALVQLKAFKVKRSFSKESKTLYQDVLAEIARIAALPKRD